MGRVDIERAGKKRTVSEEARNFLEHLFFFCFFHSQKKGAAVSAGKKLFLKISPFFFTRASVSAVLFHH